MIATGEDYRPEPFVPRRVHEMLQEVIDRLEWRDRKKYEKEITLIYEARLTMERWVAGDTWDK